MDPPAPSDVQPDHPAHSQGQTLGRRRSSVYDPARDTFTDFQTAVSKNSSSSQPSSPTQKTWKAMSSSPESRKRPRSPPTRDSQYQEGDTEPPVKRHKPVEGEETTNGALTPGSEDRLDKKAAKLPRIPKREAGEIDAQPSRTPSAFSDRRPDTNQDSRRRPDDERPRDLDRVRERPRRRSRSPGRRVPQAYRRRSPPRPAKRDPSPISRSPSPIRDEPAPNLPRPGGGRGRGRNILAEQERRKAEREREEGISVNQGVQGVVSQWYNAVPEYVKERGRDWRRNESQIKGLRSFNNWVKSCIIQKFSPQEKPAVQEEELGWGETAKEPQEIRPLLVLDIGCGKGGDLGKWDKAPQSVGLYVGLDPADQSILQARDRYKTMWKGRRPRFDARFAVKDCFGEWIGDVPIIQEVGIDPTPNSMNRWGRGGGFDVVTMMFTMHYSFESQAKVEMMLRNVAGALKKGGRLIGVCPNSDVLSDRVKDWFKRNGSTPQATNGPPQQNDQTAPRVPTVNPQDSGDASAPAWGNSIYSVRFPPPSASLPPLSADGSFRPPFGHKYTYYIAEAVDVPEFVVPWEAFRAIAENYGLEQRYRKGFLDIWYHETDPRRATNTGVGATGASTGGWGQASPDAEGADSTAAVARELEQLGMRMGVIRHPGGPLLMTEEEKEAVAFYHGFCFVKN